MNIVAPSFLLMGYKNHAGYGKKYTHPAGTEYHAEVPCFPCLAKADICTFSLKGAYHV